MWVYIIPNLNILQKVTKKWEKKKYVPTDVGFLYYI